MDCKEWDKFSQDYLKGELSEEESEKFESHIAECDYCLEHIDSSYVDFNGNSVVDILGEAPSSELDNRLNNLVQLDEAKEQKITVGWVGMFSTFMKKAAVPVALFAMAFTFTFFLNRENNEVNSGTMASNTEVINKVDSSSDSSSDTDSVRTFIQGGGNGGIPVSLEGE